MSRDDASSQADDAKKKARDRRRLQRLGARSSNRSAHNKARTRELFRRYKEEGDLEARRELIENHMSYVRYLASKYRDSSEPMQDLIQVGAEGLIKAVDRFDPGLDNEFTTYATPTIDGEIKRYFRDKGWMVRPPRRLQELSDKVGKVRDTLTGELGHVPTVPEIADRLGVSVDEVLSALEAASAYSSVSLERSSSTTDEDAPSVLDRFHDEDKELATFDDRMVLEQVLDEFSQREQDVFQMRFVEGLKQVEIAERLGISQVQVSRLLRRMITKAREKFED